METIMEMAKRLVTENNSLYQMMKESDMKIQERKEAKEIAIDASIYEEELIEQVV